MKEQIQQRRDKTGEIINKKKNNEMTQDVNCVISLISIFVFRLSHHIAALFLSRLGGKIPQKLSDTVKNIFSFATLVPSYKTCNKLRRCCPMWQ